MSAAWWLGNLAAYSIQVALVVAVGGLAAAALRMRQPRVMLAYWQALLAACLLLPVVEPWQQTGLAPTGIVATAVSRRAAAVDSLASSLSLPGWGQAQDWGCCAWLWGFGVLTIIGARRCASLPCPAHCATHRRSSGLRPRSISPIAWGRR
jgi:hypothetical protein